MYAILWASRDISSYRMHKTIWDISFSPNTNFHIFQRCFYRWNCKLTFCPKSVENSRMLDIFVKSSFLLAPNSSWIIDHTSIERQQGDSGQQLSKVYSKWQLRQKRDRNIDSSPFVVQNSDRVWQLSTVTTIST